MKANRRTAIWRTCLGSLAVAASLLAWLTWPNERLLQQRAEALLSLRDHILLGLWAATAMTAGTLGVLTMVCPWWSGAPTPTPGEPPLKKRAALAWFWALVLSAALVLGVVAGTRVNQSLFEDEAASLREATHGKFVLRERGRRLQFRAADWEQALYSYASPNNHVPYSLQARLTLSGWRQATGLAGHRFSEAALRLPALIFGVLGVFSVALMLKEFGNPLAGAIAAWVLALHPWYERYAAEARAYSMVMALLPVTIIVWRKALITGRRRYWSLFVMLEVFLVWAYPGVLLLLALINAATVALVLWSRSTAHPARTLLSRWFCCSCLAACLMAPLMFPLASQIGNYFAGDAEKGDRMDAAWMADTACMLLTGASWGEEEPAGIARDVRSLFVRSPWLPVSSLIVVVLCLFLGLRSLSRQSPLTHALAWCVALTLIFQIATSKALGVKLHPWYLIYLLPLLAAIFATGLAGLVGRTDQGGRRRCWKSLIPLAGIALLFATTQPIRRWQQTHPATPLRESVMQSKGLVDPFAASSMETLTLYHVVSTIRVYEPRAREVASAEDMIARCFNADRRGEIVWFNDMAQIFEEKNDRLAKLLCDPRFFDSHQRIHGHNKTSDRIICRYIPGSLTKNDWQMFLE